ncbi:MAG: hypothetical protein ACRC62_15755 [Microcoleus sp.]
MRYLSGFVGSVTLLIGCVTFAGDAIAVTFTPPRGDAPKETVGAGSRMFDDERGSGRIKIDANEDAPRRCRRPGEIRPDLPRCPVITSLPE